MRRLMVMIVLLLVVGLLVTVSCARAPSMADEGAGKVGPAVPTTPAAPAPPQVIVVEREEGYAPAEPSVTVPGELDTGEPWATERMIVRTGDMSLVVEDVAAAIDQITGMANGFEGYVVSSRVWQEGKRLVGSISIRVPAMYFDSAIRGLRELAVDVTSEQTSSKDVTEEYVDLSAKLQNLEATEAQLLKIMEKAETVEDILDVQRELSRTRGEIEQTKARMQYLERTSATSLITIHLEQSKLGVELFANKATVKEREAIRFWALVSGGFSPYSYEWDLGDGNTSTGEALTHAYRTDGSYTVSLTVTDDRGSVASETRVDYITVLPGWSAGAIVSGAWDGLVSFGRVLASIFIWIGVFIPVWIVIAGIVFGIIYWYHRRRKNVQ